jgi:hypothetical protein
VRRKWKACLSSSGRSAKNQHWVAVWTGFDRQHNLTILDNYAVGEWSALGTEPANTSSQWRLAGRTSQASDSMPSDVTRVRNGSRRGGNRTKKRISASQTQRLRDSLLLLQHQTVTGPTGGLMQGIANIQQETRCGGKRLMGHVGQP